MMAGKIFLLLGQLLSIYYAILFVRIIMSWVAPQTGWHKQPFKFVYEMTEPVMAPFRQIIPPLGGIDFSPILLFILVQFVSGQLKMIGSQMLMGS